jgi:hypothetical protein
MRTMSTGPRPGTIRQRWIIILINPGIIRLHVIRESGWTIRGFTIIMAEEGIIT